MKSVTLVLALVIVGVFPASNVAISQAVSAQSLGALARQETERRKTIPAAAKVITDKDLQPAEPPSRVPTAPAATSATPVVATPASSMNTPSEGKYVARDASYWLSRMRELQTKQDRFNLQAAALQNRADGLSNEFDSIPDRLRRSTIEFERQKVRTEHALVMAEIAATNKQIDL